jgi:hypothetical protein
MLSDMAEGIARESEGKRGVESCREYNVVNLEAFDTAGRENRGRNEESIDPVVM